MGLVSHPICDRSHEDVDVLKNPMDGCLLESDILDVDDIGVADKESISLTLIHLTRDIS